MAELLSSELGRDSRTGLISIHWPGSAGHESAGALVVVAGPRLFITGQRSGHQSDRGQSY